MTREQEETREAMLAEYRQVQIVLDEAGVPDRAMRLSLRIVKLLRDRNAWEKRARELEALCADRL